MLAKCRRTALCPTRSLGESGSGHSISDKLSFNNDNGGAPLKAALRCTSEKHASMTGIAPAVFLPYVSRDAEATRRALRTHGKIAAEMAIRHCHPKRNLTSKERRSAL
jgi:hypothetical protein